MRTHVSMDGCLYRVGNLVARASIVDGEFRGYGWYVNPNGHYDGAPLVRLYVSNGRYVAC
jgi:hypothetical protein